MTKRRNAETDDGGNVLKAPSLFSLASDLSNVPSKRFARRPVPGPVMSTLAGRPVALGLFAHEFGGTRGADWKQNNR